jgi:hypothetical protein
LKVFNTLLKVVKEGGRERDLTEPNLIASQVGEEPT